MDQIQSITSCSGWFFIPKTEKNTHGAPIPVAAWAVLTTGEVVGLISVDLKEAVTGANVARLVQPPPLGGHYVREQDLSSYPPDDKGYKSYSSWL